MPSMQYRTLAIEPALQGIQNVTPKGVHLIPIGQRGCFTASPSVKLDCPHPEQRHLAMLICNDGSGMS